MKIVSSVLCLGRVVLRAKYFNRHAPLSESRLHIYLSICKRASKSQRGILRTSSSKTRISGQCSDGLGWQVDPAPVLGAGGKSSTWSPSGRLAELHQPHDYENQESCINQKNDACLKHGNAKRNSCSAITCVKCVRYNYIHSEHANPQ